MRRPRLFWRIYATYLVIVVLCTAAVGFYAVRSVRDFYLDHTERELQARAALVREQVLPAIAADTPQELEALVQRLGEASGTRITVIAADRPGAAQGRGPGRLGLRPAEMENHATVPSSSPPCEGRPGRAIRYSKTLRQDMMYVAVPGHRGRPPHDRRPHGASRSRASTTRWPPSTGASRSARSSSPCSRRSIGLYVSRRISGQMRADQGRRRAPGGRGLHAQAVRAARRGVRLGGREHQPDGRGAGRQAAPAHPRAQRARGGARQHGRGRARRRHRRARDRRERRRRAPAGHRSGGGRGQGDPGGRPQPRPPARGGADARRPPAGGGRYRHARGRRGAQPPGQRHVAARGRRRRRRRRRRRAQRRDAPQAARGGAARLRRQRVPRAQDAGHLHQGLRRDARGRRPGRSRRRRAASCASSRARPTA